MSKSSSVLFGRGSVVVDRVEIDTDSVRMVHLSTGEVWVGVCLKCQIRSTRSKGWVRTQPRDLRFGPDRPHLVWTKRKWLCINTSCQRKSFTRRPTSCRPAADSRPGPGRRWRWLCWMTTARSPPSPPNTAAAGTPATAPSWPWPNRRWPANPNRCECWASTRPAAAKRNGGSTETEARLWVDRWNTGLVDIAGTQGVLAQVNGRTSRHVIAWLSERDQAWRDGGQFVTIDMSAVYAKAAKEALQHAQIVVDRFHLVKRANAMIDAVRQWVTRAMRGRRGRKSRPGIAGSTQAFSERRNR